MKLDPYLEYKDSGIEWLGKIPDSWSISKLKYVCEFSGGGTPDTSKDEYWDGKIPWVSSKDMKSESIWDTEDKISLEGLKSSAAKIVRQGSAIIVVRSGILKHTIPIAINEIPVAVNQDLRAIDFVNNIEPKFFLRWVQGLQEELLIAWRKQGATVESLEQEYLSNTLFPFPTLQEQLLIGIFLDREISKIDIIISEQKELIAILREKRQTVISCSVTKGIRSNVTMKDSGIDWLGEIPGHWKMKRLKQVAEVRGGVAKGKDQRGVKTIFVPYLRVANVQDGYLDLTEVAEIEIPPNELGRYLLRTGDVLMNEGGDFDKLGRGHIWQGQISPCIHQNHVFSVRPHSIRSEWLAAITSSDYAKFFFMCRANQSTNLASISLTNLSELPVTIPPESEQVEIVNYLDRETSKLDILINDANSIIILLQEHRTALISAVVTGKVDVREVACV